MTGVLMFRAPGPATIVDPAVDLRAKLATLEATVAELRACLAPLAALAGQMDRLNRPDEHILQYHGGKLPVTLTAGDCRRARRALDPGR